MKKLMILAAVAAVAMVGAVNAVPTYDMFISGALTPYKYDTNPGDAHGGWYSFYAMKQEDAQKAMGTTETVTYETMAAWLGEDFAGNRQSVIDNAYNVEFAGYQNNLYEFMQVGGAEPGVGSAISVAFYNDGANVAYGVMANFSNNMIFGEISDYAPSSGWQAVAVPEPTSGLLLLLGVAGLALRRKRA